MIKEERSQPPIKVELWIFFAIVALTGLSMGLTDGVISNFFKDAYDVTAVQRGFLELPRELPGLLCFMIIALTTRLGDIRLAILAQLLSAIGAAVLGFFTPSFAVMCLFVFTHSMGFHVYTPLQESIGISIIGKQDLGKRMGQYGGIRIIFTMLASMLVFIGFRTGVFSFKTQIKLPYIIGAAGFFGVFVLFTILLVKYKVHGEPRKKQFQLIIRKKYTLFYILAILTGVHRQIMMVFGPWVLIEILRRQADTLALLGLIGSFFAAFLLPALGRWADRYGTKMILLAEGILFILVYLAYGYYSHGFKTGVIALAGIPVLVVYGLFIFDRLAMHLGMVRAMYLKSIAVDPADIAPTLSMGLSMDHVVSISGAYLGGLVWFNYGPHYVFFIAAALSVINVIAALLIRTPTALSRNT